MTRQFLGLLLTVLFSHLAYGQDPWITPFEQSGGRRTPRFDETMAYCRRLAQASPWVRVTDFGTSPQGRALPLVIVSREGFADAGSARSTRKGIILIQSGIHAGEIDGKDASLMLIREIAVHKSLAGLIDSTILLFVPIFNVDGHERFGPYNRINQNGPEEMGWRVTAQNLNLNRDYMKAEAPEMRAMLRLFAAWLPDLVVDCHVTDGIDFQYDVTYAVEPPPSLDRRVSEWLTSTLLPPALNAVERAGHPIYYYVFPREERDLSRGLKAEAATPRFSTAYCALQNRPAVLIETHMLKPYKARVEATYAFLKGMIETVNARPSALKAAVRSADGDVAARGPGGEGSFPLDFGLGEKSTLRLFRGVRQVTEKSPVSGGTRLRYLPDTLTMMLPFYEEVTVTDSVHAPFAYLIPREWTFAEEKLRAHGIRVERLRKETTLEVEEYRCENVRFRERPYEGRHIPTFSTTLIREQRSFPPGTLVVRPRQRAGNVAVHLLEPRGPDSFAAWGFFNAIFEQKEYAEAYVMEDKAPAMLTQDPVLRAEYERKVATDTAFAASPSTRLNWLYQRSPWKDATLSRYPVARLVGAQSLDTEPLAGTGDPAH